MSEQAKYGMLTKAVVVKDTEDAIFGETATTIALEDEGSGLYVTVSQTAYEGEQKIGITTEDWPAVREAIEQMLAICEAQNGKEANAPPKERT